MPELKITEDESAPANTAQVRDGKLVVSPEMMAELREFVQSGDLVVRPAESEKNQ